MISKPSTILSIVLQVIVFGLIALAILNIEVTPCKCSFNHHYDPETLMAVFLFFAAIGVGFNAWFLGRVNSKIGKVGLWIVGVSIGLLGCAVGAAYSPAEVNQSVQDVTF